MLRKKRAQMNVEGAGDAGKTSGWVVQANIAMNRSGGKRNTEISTKTVETSHFLRGFKGIWGTKGSNDG